MKKNCLINFLLKLKNASQLKKEFVIIKYTKSCEIILKDLYIEGFVQSYKIIKNKNQFYFFIILRFFQNKSTLKTIKIVSNKKSALSLLDLISLKNKNSILFLSTNKGLLTTLNCKKYKAGGNPLFYIK